MNGLSGKVALVTGASRGIGFAIANRLSLAGAQVVMSGRNTDRLEKAVHQLRETGKAVESLPFDASIEASVDAAMEDIGDRHGRIDVLANNAGVLIDKDVFETSIDEWNAVIANNLTSAFLCSRAAMRLMREKENGGRIVMIGSTAGQRGAPAGVVSYSASKAGLIGLAQTLAYTGAPLGITVNVVSPGMIRTEMLEIGFGARLCEMAQRVPLGLGEPADVADAVLYLVGESGRYITGATLDVNGGLYHR